MRTLTKSRTYLRVRRWIDHDITTRYRSPSLSLSMMATIFLAFGFRAVDGRLSLVIWLFVLTISGCWTGFVIWRAVRMMRAMSIKGDRQYDQRGKHHLPPEYARSESVTAASRRERVAKRDRSRRSPA